MSPFDSQQDNSSAERSPKSAVEQYEAGRPGDTEILFERPTAWQHPREVLRYGITDAALMGQTALFDVLPGIGKSRSVSKICGTVPVSIFTNLRDNYEQFERWGREDGVPVEKLPTRDLCPTLRDENYAYPDDQAAQEAREARDSGWPASTIHREFKVPCNRGDHACPYLEATAKIDPDGLALLVGHFTQAYNPAYVEGRVVVIDERCFKAYNQEIKKSVEKAEEFITTLDGFPFDGLPYKPSDTELEEALEILENEGLEPADYRDAVGEFHAKAPLIAYALLTADKMENDWFVADLPGDRTATFHQRPGKSSLHILDPPDFSKAEAVIALDATPCVSNWRRILGDDPTHYHLFDDDQRNRYLHEQGYEFIQLNGYVWGVSNTLEVQVSKSKCEAYLREVYRKHGQRPDLITSKALLMELREEGLGDLWRDDLHYGDLRGKNDLKDSGLLVVLGSPSRRDGDIQHHAALHGECAIPATDEDGERLSGYKLDYQSEVANEYLQTVRRGEVFQAAMRAGQTEDAEATVYIATGMVPDWLETKKIGERLPRGSFDACARPREESDRAVIEVLRDEDDISGREAARRADLPKSTARDALDRLRDEGVVELQGLGRGAEWHADCIEEANIAGYVELRKTADIPYNNSIRASRPFSEPIIQPRELPDDPTRRYPGWMRDVQQRAQHRKFEEQCKQRWRNTP